MYISLLLVIPAVVLGQATSRLRTRTSTGAVCTNTPAPGVPLPTSTFVAMLLAHLTDAEDCPGDAVLNLHYHDVGEVGCCTQSATLTVASGTSACCVCGATCTGSVPSVLDWTTTAGQFMTSPATVVPTVSNETPGVSGTTTAPATRTSQTGQPTDTSAAANAATLNIQVAVAMVGLAAGVLALL